MSCTRCGRPTEYPEDWHCASCERDYHRQQAEDYEAGTPRPVQVGTAFGGPVVIEVHEKEEFCGCRGSGWHNTDYDSWHKCPHHDGPHPEYDEPQHYRRNARRKAKKKAKKTRSSKPVFPESLTLTWPNGDEEVLYFQEPNYSARGNLNAWAGDKIIRGGRILRINCNVTDSRG
jgi:hypothetical protein